jgi:uracil-DNA glycosylase family 4
MPEDNSSAFLRDDLVAIETIFEELEGKIAISEKIATLEKVRDNLYYGSQDKLVSLKTLHTQVLNCKVCPHLKNAGHLPKWNIQSPSVVFVLEEPFQLLKTDAASFFVNTLKEVGFSSKNIAVTSLVRCEGYKGDEKDIETCGGRYIDSELQLMSPKVIALMGRKPLQFYFPERKIAEIHGNLLHLGTWLFMPLYSPAHASFQEQIQAPFKQDLQKLYSYIQNSTE